MSGVPAVGGASGGRRLGDSRQQAEMAYACSAAVALNQAAVRSQNTVEIEEKWPHRLPSLREALQSWMARPITSLPDPVSPTMGTGAIVQRFPESPLSERNSRTAQLLC